MRPSAPEPDVLVLGLVSFAIDPARNSTWLLPAGTAFDSVAVVAVVLTIVVLAGMFPPDTVRPTSELLNAACVDVIVVEPSDDMSVARRAVVVPVLFSWYCVPAQRTGYRADAGSA